MNGNSMFLLLMFMGLIFVAFKYRRYRKTIIGMAIVVALIEIIISGWS